MAFPLFQVDAFTAVPFAGNPAAVCLLPAPAEPAWMQRVAREMNLSETAFLARREDGWGLRWFTPAVEVALCGHATLASAHVLWEEAVLTAGEEARFHTQSGLLTCRKTGAWVEMDFPSTVEQPASPPDSLAEALGATPRYVGRNKFDFLVEVDSEETVRALAPDHALLRTLPVRGVIVTSRSADPRFDFVSRFFAPGSGIEEDPVTGSSHCCLAPFWGKRLKKTGMTAFQASARGGVVRVTLQGDRVLLGGQAVTVLRGQLL